MDLSQKKKADYWIIAFSVILLIGFPYIGRMLFSAANPSVITLIFGGLGGLAGFSICSLVRDKKKSVKILSLIAETVFLCILVYFTAWFYSDPQIVKRSWKTHQIEMVSFQYPNSFKEIKVDGLTDNVSKMRIFSDGDKDRIAMYMVYDFAGNAPGTESSLKGSITNSLTNINAEDLTYFDVKLSNNIYQTKFSYKIAEKEFVGLGFIFTQNSHFESILFVPVKRKYSNDYLDKISSGIRYNNSP